MEYLALYRRYRPTTFENLIGQDHIVKTLTNQIMSGRLGHAYLFTGTRGTGKTSAAKIFAKAVNCLSPVNGSPCGKCSACVSLSDTSNVDVVEIDAASNNGVNEIRELREKVQYQPVSCRYKVYIIDEVHMLTGAAFNALLKTLEEPPKHVIFILATTEVHKIPATILSRCMRFDFRLISTEKIAELISNIYLELGKKFDKEAVFALAKAGEGSIRDALSVADTALSYNSGTLTYNDVMDILGSSGDELTSSFIRNVLLGNSGAVLDAIDKLSALGKSMGVLIKEISSAIRDLLVVKTCSNPNAILMLPENTFLGLKQLADLTSEERLLRILEIFAQSENSLKYTNHPRVVFETSAIKATRPESDYNIEALLSRIKTLEDKLEKGEFSVSQQPVNHVQQINQPKVEQVVEQIPTTNYNEKRKLNSFSETEFKGKLLAGLRAVGSEMLWNVIQNVTIKIAGNVLSVTTLNDGDTALLDKQESRNRIYEALDDVERFEIKISLSDKEKSLDEIDQATERVKSIFGDDIVIIS